MFSHEFYMLRALALAKEAVSEGEVPVGAVVVYDNQIIAEAYNAPIKNCDPTAHAEILALRQAAEKIGNYRLIDTTLYVTLEPCAMCAAALVHARVKSLVFAASDPKRGAVHSALSLLDDRSCNHQVLWQSGVLADEGLRLLQAFFRDKR